MNILKKIFGLRKKENKKVDTIPDKSTEYAEEKSTKTLSNKH